MISVLLFAILFGAADYWMAMVRIQQAEHIKNFYLDRARLEGCLLDHDRAEMEYKMDKIGLEVTGVTAPTERLTRSLTDYPVIELNIKTKFKSNPFMLGFFLGKENILQPEFYGKVVSEYAGS
jgi:hypothetical protein